MSSDATPEGPAHATPTPPTPPTPAHETPAHETPAHETPAHETSADVTRRRARTIRRAPILLVVVVALVAAVVAQRNAPSAASSTSSRARAAAQASAGVPPVDAASSAWYCAAGTSSPDGDATETVLIASLAHDPIDVTVTVMPGGDARPATRSLRLAPGAETSVPVADVLATAEPGVVVEAVGGAAAVSHQLVHGGDVAVESCTRTAATDSYFASGTTVEGSRQELALFNPFGDDAIVDVSFVTDTGAQEPADLQAMVVPRRSRVTVPVQDAVLRQHRVAAHVHARAGRVVVDQTQTFDDASVDGVTRSGIALSGGATSPSTVWRVPAGSTRDGGRAQLALANFSRDDARVAVKTTFAGGTGLPTQEVRVPSLGVVWVDVTSRVPLDTDVAVTATSQAVDGRRVPVVGQLFATWPATSSSTGVAATVGTDITATRWVVPVPDVDATTIVTVFNPGPEPVTAAVLAAVDVDRRVGPRSEPELAVAPGAAKSLRLPAGTTLVPRVVTADHPVVVGLTVLGSVGAAVSTALPDLGHADPTTGG